MCVLALDVEVQTETVSLELQQALLNDIRVLDYNKELPNGQTKPVYKLRENLPFWMKNSKGSFENRVYFMHSGVNRKDINDYLNNGQIYIHKDYVNREIA